MTWETVCADKSLQDLPYKIETNRHGNIIMSPASNKHSLLQARIARYIGNKMTSGDVLSECPIDTNSGVKVADIAWASDAYIDQFIDLITFPIAPQLCIEVVSPSNSETEMTLKRELYFSQGAEEVWMCDLEGNISFYLPTGETTLSTLFPDFPKEV